MQGLLKNFRSNNKFGVSGSKDWNTYMEPSKSSLRFRSYFSFVGVVSLAHVITYIVIGMLAYHLIYKSAIDAGGFDQFMRNPSNPGEWQHVETWLLPAQVLRGLLFGIALCPFLTTLVAWDFKTGSVC